MTNPKKGGGPESGDEPRLEAYKDEIERFLAVAEEDLTDLGRRLNLPLADVLLLAVVLFRRHIELTEDPDVFVLVIKGDAKPYNSAFEAFLDLSQGELDIGEALEHLRPQSRAT